MQRIIALHSDCTADLENLVQERGECVWFPLLGTNRGLAQILQDPYHGIGSYREHSSRMQASDPNMYRSLREPEERTHDVLSRRFDGRLRVIAKQSVTYWFSHERLDKLLAQYIGSLEGCELLYAIDQGGRQVSSNIYSTSIDSSAYGQDLSHRPYAVSLAVLKNVASHGAFACDAYVSQTTQQSCVTVMYGVTSGSTFMGFIAADFYPAAD